MTAASAAIMASATAGVRLRTRRDGGVALTLVEPKRNFYGMLTSTGRSRHRVVTTVSGRTWSEIEIAQHIGLGRRVVGRTIVTTGPIAGGAIEIVRSKLNRGGREVGRSVTTIESGGGFRWKNFGRGGIPLGEGAVRDGSGSGTDNQGRAFTWSSQGNRTTVTTQQPNGGTKTVTTVKRPDAIVQDLEVKDQNGQTTARGTKVENPTTGDWSRTTVVTDGQTTQTSTDTGNKDNSQTTHSQRTEVNGQVTSEERSASAKDGQGNSSTTSSEIDYGAGTVRIVTTSKGADGSETQHITVTDFAGNIISDSTTSPSGGGGGTPSGGGDGDDGEGGGDPDDGSGGDGDDGGGDDTDDGGGDDGPDDGDGGGDDTDDGGGDDGPDDGDGGGGGDDGAQDPDGDDGSGGRPNWKPGGQEGDIPSFPDGIVGSILGDLGVPTGGGDPDEGGNLPEVIRQRIRGVIATNHDASSADGGEGGGGEGNDFGMVEIDIRMPAPPGAVDDWGDRPNPRALVATVADSGIALAMAGSELRRVGQVLAGRQHG
jgi:hypothetical protein